ncbi:MAG: hypothetical protein ACI9U2_001651 [Bradymonadia bacterium]|jgi:hypothetical protein
MSDRALIEFSSEAEVRGLLRMFANDPGNMHTLREVLAAEGGGYHVSGLTDTQVVDRIAPILARSCVGLIRTELLPVRSAGSAGTSTEFDNPDPIFDPLVESEFEIEDPIPLAVLPPVFPIVASQEAESVLGESRLYKLVLDMLKFVGLSGEGESEIAKQYTSEANQTAEVVGEMTANFGAEIKPLGADAHLAQAPSETVQTLSYVNGQQRDVIKHATGGATDALGTLLEGARDAAAPSELGPALQSEGGRQGGRIVDASGTVGETLGGLLEGENPAPAPSTVGFALRANSAQQGESITGAAGSQTETLDALAAPALPGEAAPDSVVAGTLTDVGGGQGERLGGSVVTAVSGLTDLIGRPEADVRALSAPGWSTTPEPHSGVRLTAIPQDGVYLVAKSDGSQPLTYRIFSTQEDGGGIEIIEMQPTIEDGLAVAYWVPETIPTDPVYFVASTEDGLVTMNGAPATLAPEASVDGGDDDGPAADSAVQAAGWMLTPSDPRQGVLDAVAAGPIYFGVKLAEPGMVKVSIFDADQGADADGNPAKPLTRFVTATDDRGQLIVPYNLARLPAGVRRMRIEVRVGQSDQILFESELPVVRRLAFGDARVVIDPTVPEV